jgi:hypothetical protein
MADTNPSTGCPVTRPTNANQHPGKVALDQVRKRRTKEEVARDNALKQEKIDQKKRQQTKGIALIAELEDRMAIDDASAEGAHPRNQKGMFVCHMYYYFRLTGFLI